MELALASFGGDDGGGNGGDENGCDCDGGVVVAMAVMEPAVTVTVVLDIL